MIDLYIDKIKSIIQLQFAPLSFFPLQFLFLKRKILLMSESLILITVGLIGNMSKRGEVFGERVEISFLTTPQPRHYYTSIIKVKMSNSDPPINLPPISAGLPSIQKLDQQNNSPSNGPHTFPEHQPIPYPPYHSNLYFFI